MQSYKLYTNLLKRNNNCHEMIQISILHLKPVVVLCTWAAYKVRKLVSSDLFEMFAQKTCRIIDLKMQISLSGYTGVPLIFKALINFIFDELVSLVLFVIINNYYL